MHNAKTNRARDPSTEAYYHKMYCTGPHSSCKLEQVPMGLDLLGT